MPDPLDISPEQLRASLDDGSPPLLLDCREPGEWQVARIDGATLIPMGEVPTRLQELDPEKPIVVYCHHGVRSRSVAQFLLQQDFDDVRSLAGGIDAWSRTIDPSVPRYR